MSAPLAVALVLGAAVLASAANADMVVSTAWLGDHLRDPNLIILHVGEQPPLVRRLLPSASPVNNHYYRKLKRRPSASRNER